MRIHSIARTDSMYRQSWRSNIRKPMSPEEFRRRTFAVDGSFRCDDVPTVEGNVGPSGLWPGEEFETREELYKKLAENYDMEHLRTGDLTNIIATLHHAGILSSSEFLYACSPIPVFSLDEIGASEDAPVTNYKTSVCEVNALTEYRDRYAEYIRQYCQNVSLSENVKLQNAMAVHNKVDSILHEIQSCRT